MLYSIADYILEYAFCCYGVRILLCDMVMAVDIQQILCLNAPRLRVVQNVAEHFLKGKENINSIEKIPRGISNSNFIVKTDKRSIILRFAPPRSKPNMFWELDKMLLEEVVHRRVQQKTNIPIPKIYKLDLTYRLFERPYIIMECLPGIDLSLVTELTRYQREGINRQLGKYLSSLHKINGVRYGYSGPNKTMEPQKTWWQGFRHMWHFLVDDVASIGGMRSDERLMMKILLDQNKKIFVHPVAPALLHTDIWDGNILVDMSGKITGILDWECVLWGDIEFELAALGWANITTDAFWKGYEYKRRKSLDEQKRRIFYLVYIILKWFYISMVRMRDPVKAQYYKTEAYKLLKEVT